MCALSPRVLQHDNPVCLSAKDFWHFFASSGGLLAANEREDLGSGNMEKEFALVIYICRTTNIITKRRRLKVGRGLQAEDLKLSWCK